MMTHAYDENFLEDAKETLGSAMEYAVLIAGLDGQRFLDMFIVCGLANEFGRGNVKYISGMSGAELCLNVMDRCGLEPPQKSEIDHMDYPKEYWIGWILAHYQWYSGKSFATICKRLKYKYLFNVYGVLHEADPSKAMSIFDNVIADSKTTNLASLRKNKGLSQSGLAEKADVSVRSIQLYEQRKANINNAQYNHLKALAKALGCDIEDLLE